MLLYGLTDKKEVVDLFTDRVEAEFAMLDVADVEPDLAEHLEVVGSRCGSFVLSPGTGRRQAGPSGEPGSASPGRPAPGRPR